ncbi:MAG: hypothetical protein IJZ68_05470 [Bacteroidaceae bacterium]|nr:hypothetical protein [Bacteroidaceae bacterium]
MYSIQIIVECPWDHSIGVNKQFEFCYTDNTRIAELLQAITGAQSIDETHLLHYQLKHKGQCFQFCPEVLLKTLLQYLQQPDTLYVEYQMGIPGGFGLDNVDGVKFEMHPNENAHTANIHATNSGDNIQINLITLKVKGKFKNRQKQKFAIEYTKQHRLEWIEEFNRSTNGIKLWNFPFEIYE